MMSNVKLDAARELIVDDHMFAARAVLETMPASTTALKWLEKLDEIAPVETPQNTGVVRWEYLEVFVKAGDRMAADMGAAIEDRAFTTVENFYTDLLNDYGADGWELLSEELQGGDFYRLLFKRPRQG